MAGAKTIVLITGANIGIGKSTAKVLTAASSDYHVIVGSRSIEKGQAAIDELKAGKLKGSLSLLQLDVTSEDSINAAVKKVEKDFGRVDTLINNAGMAGLESDSLKEKMQVTYEANAIGPALVTEAFKPLLLKSDHPRLIFVSSGLGSVAMKLADDNPHAKAAYLPYRLSKSALNMLMAVYHVELKDQGVKVHTMCPGFVATNLRRDPTPLATALDPDTSGETLKAMIEGHRDADVGKFVHNTEWEEGSQYNNGLYPWGEASNKDSVWGLEDDGDVLYDQLESCVNKDVGSDTGKRTLTVVVYLVPSLQSMCLSERDKRHQVDPQILSIPLLTSLESKQPDLASPKTLYLGVFYGLWSPLLASTFHYEYNRLYLSLFILYSISGMAKVLVLSLEDDSWMDDDNFMQQLRERAEPLLTCRDADGFLAALKDPSLNSMFVFEPSIMRNKKLSNALAAWTKAGGTVIFGACSSSFIGPGEVNTFFRVWFNKPWESGEYHRTTSKANTNLGLELGNGVGKVVPRPISMKAVHLRNVAPEDAVLLPTDNARIQSLVFAPTRVEADGQTPVVFAKHFEGKVGWVGDVNNEADNVLVVLAMLGV